uniref:Uncharacterized protein n=1 Tax=Buteo japonicus TaxID=224669 RepID=A0A8B9Z5W1_9AVES
MQALSNPLGKRSSASADKAPVVPGVLPSGKQIPTALKRESLLPVSSASKENGVRVEQDDQDLFAGESVSTGYLGLSEL